MMLQLNDHNKHEFEPAHTCEHIINQTMIRMFNCGRAVSAHVERKKSKLDFRMSIEPSEQQMLRLEEEVNRIISQDLPVTMSYITLEEAKQFFDLNRLPDDASDTVRVVKIGDYDQCLCIGAHVEHTSEIGTFKLLSYSFSEGVLRLRWKVVQ